MRLASVSGPSGSTLAARLDDGLYDLRAVEPSLPDGVGPLLEANGWAISRSRSAFLHRATSRHCRGSKPAIPVAGSTSCMKQGGEAKPFSSVLFTAGLLS